MIDQQLLEDPSEPGRVGLYCLLNCERECGADCMAFLPVVPEGDDYRMPDGEARQWARCMILINLHKISKHLVHIAAKAEEAMKLVRTSKADQQRGQAIGPPPITIGPGPSGF
jgi:hypothetical protein